MSDLKLEWPMSNAVSPPELILRGVFTHFLNLGTFDDRMQEASSSPAFLPKSARVDHVGTAFLGLHNKAVKWEFIVWIKGNELADFLCTKSIRDFMNSSFENKNYISPFDMIIGTRFKLVTTYGRKQLPKDLKKSFYTKASNRLQKFAVEYNKNVAQWGQIRGEDVGAWNDTKQVKTKPADIETWLRFVFSKQGKESYLSSKNLSEIRNLYWRMASHEPLDEVVQELLKLAAITDVMTR